MARWLLIAAAVGSLAFDFAWVGEVELEAERLTSKVPETRQMAARNLARYDIVHTLPHLLRALDDPDAKVRITAAHALAQHGALEAVPVLMTWLTDPDPQIKQAGARVLGELGAAEAVPALVRSLGDPDPQVRFEVVIALGKIGTPEVVVALLGRLEDDKAEVRAAAVDQLAAIGDPRAVVPLVGAFDDASVDVRIAAVRAVGRLGDLAAVPALIRSLADSNDRVAVEAVGAIGNLRAVEAAPLLIEELERGRAHAYRVKVAYALGQLGAAGHDEALRVLVRLLADRRMRTAAVEALRAAGRAAVPALIAHLDGELEGDPASAVELLRDAADPAATPALVAELGRARVPRELVLQAIGAAGDGRALIPVLALLEDPDPAVRLSAMRALRPLLDPRAADVLIGALSDADLEVRVLAADYLGAIRARAAVPALTAIATAPRDKLRLRYTAIGALGAIGDERAAAPLIELLADGPRALRRPAALALARIRAPSSVAPLVELVRGRRGNRVFALRALGGVLRDRPHPEVVTLLADIARRGRTPDAVAAIDALAAIGDPAAGSTLLELARGDDGARARAACAALATVEAPGRVAVLLEALARSDDRVSAEAAWALGVIGDHAAVPALARAASGRAWATAINASWALAASDAPVDAVQLVRLLHHPNRFVRVNAARALGRRRVAEGDAPLRVALQRDPSWLVRAAAAAALHQLGGADDALARAARGDASEYVRAAAAAPPEAPPPRDQFLELFVVDADSGEPARNEPYFIAASDGLVTAHHTDVTGQIVEERFPAGPYQRAPRTASERF